MLLSRVVVKEAEEVIAHHGVDDLINPRQPKGVLGAVFVEISVVDTHPPLVRVLPADEDGVGDALSMENSSGEAGRE
jgi:hypothetical protein